MSFNNGRLPSSRKTRLHIAIEGNNPDDGYASYEYISLDGSGRNGCAFSVATNADHPVEQVPLSDVHEMRCLGTKVEEDDVRSDVSTLLKLRVVRCEMSPMSNQR